MIMQIWLQERNENIFLKQHLSMFFWLPTWTVYRKYGYFCFGLDFGLILAIEILQKHMILALLDFSIAFLAIYIYICKAKHKKRLQFTKGNMTGRNHLLNILCSAQKHVPWQQQHLACQMTYKWEDFFHKYPPWISCTFFKDEDKRNFFYIIFLFLSFFPCQLV
jgi:hypothetical protein